MQNRELITVVAIVPIFILFMVILSAVIDFVPGGREHFHLLSLGGLGLSSLIATVIFLKKPNKE